MQCDDLNLKDAPNLPFAFLSRQHRNRELVRVRIFKGTPSANHNSLQTSDM